MNMSKIFVNGSIMEKAFFDENIEEASRLNWAKADSSNSIEHKHCIVCMKSISFDSNEDVYQSGTRYLCVYCYQHYIRITGLR